MTSNDENQGFKSLKSRSGNRFHQMTNSKPKKLKLCQISHLNVSVNIHHRLKLPRQRGQYVFRCEKRIKTKAQRTAQLEDLKSEHWTDRPYPTDRASEIGHGQC